MARIISIHSYRGGTGKSNLTANVAQMGLYFDAEPAMVSNRLKNFDGYVWKAHEWDLG